ncbi:glycosyl transferase [Rhizobium leguminosarum bv. trifolii CB782]|uniref:Glycosyl transferase n=1 Tax=Rhizobium hidalgonense TaxID=1538159 RepID=A0A2A6KE34_9HYPH|nr:glycosyltransferase family A protein [Rhizobium hidalgonense]AHG44267.1 glycosyl transferase [Rhizobium leguminosarum bv. trifolii CB782]MDR9775630.1 glycosyl transferase [Rhizobium hidalgonense]MDR9808690.1 glycosyl transferase [Rhizobium hidalgonense]MDR9812561.1 glycosyl transferase [Rhizobium hidalgonense]MDR9822271.1 glycosyl transferase [Rhizobium hidalgonense]
MLTVVLECQDQEAELAQTLSVLVAGAVEGIVSDVVVLDHGSRDGTSRVADAAGCRFYSQWDINDIVRSARGEWLLFVEPGARPQAGWIDEIAEYIALNKLPARFTASRGYRRPFFQRIGRAAPPLELGLLMPKGQALAVAKSGMRLAEFAQGQKPRKLSSELIPAWVARAAR